MTKPFDFDSAQENLAASLPGYEPRAKQGALAHKIESQIRGEGTSRHALLQASTGTGKSLAYLIPAILSGKRVVISTATKALQDQIANKDLPFLAEHLGVDFTYAVLKGRSNYLCRAELKRLEDDNPALFQRINEKLKTLDLYSNAERDDLEVKDAAEWGSLSVGGGDCVGRQQCPFGKECFAEKAKAYAQSCQVVVVNHALLLTDLWLDEISGGGAQMIGDYDVVVIDEAHELVDYATNVWGVTLREQSLISLANDGISFLGKVGSPDSRDFASQVSVHQEVVNNLWKDLEEGRLREAHVIEMGDKIVAVYDSLIELRGYITRNARKIQNGKRDEEELKKLFSTYHKLLRRFENSISAVQDLIATAADFNEEVRWVEKEVRKVRRGKAQESKVIKRVPINMGKILDRELWASNRRCRACNFDGTHDPKDFCKRCGGSGFKTNVTSILVSATLTVNNRFDYIARELGLPHYESFDVGTPFDFPNQARLYVPSHLPEPTQANRSAWEGQSISEIGDLIKASNGRALLLFTSVKQMRAAYDHISTRTEYKCLIQGQGTNKDLAAEFMEDVHSVLFATRSFFTGVDFSGDACSLVVVDKLPFPVPTDAIIEARSEAIERDGGNSFNDYTVPLMTLVLQQAFGRLIRHTTDTGVVAILDRRLCTKGYGKKIVASLPNAPMVETIEEVQDFFAKETV